MSKLFEPRKIGAVTAKNRIVYPPVVMFGAYGTPEGTVDENYLTHFKNIANGGPGLIETPAVTIAENTKVIERQLGLWNDKQIDGLAKIADICHERDIPVFMQLQHSGLRACRPYEPVTACEYKKVSKNKDGEPVETVVRGLTVLEMDNIKLQFVAAAQRAQKAGYDGVELHGAHGYLLSQYLTPHINKRSDQYGRGSLYPAEIIAAIKQVCGGAFAVGIRMGMNDPDLKTSIAHAQHFERAGADFLHVSFGYTQRIAEDISLPPDYPLSVYVYGGHEIKQQVGIPVIVVNNILTPAQAHYAAENEVGDFVAMARAILVENHLPNKMKTGEPVRLCLNCPKCSWYRPDGQCPGVKRPAVV